MKSSILSSKKLEINPREEAIGSNLAKTLRMIESGGLQLKIVKKNIQDSEKSVIFKNFLPYFISLEKILLLNETKELISYCKKYSTKNETLPIEKRLEKITGNYCRQKVLGYIKKSFEKTNTINDDELIFIQDNLKYYLSKKLNLSFSAFIKSLAKNKLLLRRISDIITQYSVLRQKVPAQEVLKDIEINEHITKLIQLKGFNPLQHQNIFHAEFNNLIDQGYKLLSNKDGENIDQEKANAHFSYIKNFIELNQDHIPLDLCLSRLNDLSKNIYRSGLVDLSRSIFNFIIKKNDPTVLEDTLFFYLWTYLRQNDYEGGLRFIEKYNLTPGQTKSVDPRLKFWIAQTYEAKKYPDKALTEYEEIIKENPLSFYAIMATKRISQLKPNSKILSLYLDDAKSLHMPLISEADLDDDYIHTMIRLRIWTKINHVKFRDLELKRLRLFNIPNLIVKFPTEKQRSIKSELHFVNALILQSTNYLLSFKYLYEAFEKNEVKFNRTLVEILYPQPYYDELKKSLSKDSIDPLIVLSLIRQESVFNPLARSPVGARGLMQLMPATARRLKRYLNVSQLNNPKINIEIGTKYFKNLLKRYENNLVYVLAAYNAGESRVQKWKNLYWTKDQGILHQIEEIPFLETRNYVKLIFRNIYFYKLLLKENPSIDSHNPNQIYDLHLGFNDQP